MLGALYKAGVTGELVQKATPHEHGMFVHYYQGVVSGARRVDLEDVSGEVKTIRNQATQKYGYFKYKGQVVLDQFLKKPVPRLPVGDMIRVTEWILDDSKKVGWGDDPALRKRRLDILNKAELAMMSFVKANAKRLNIEPGTDAYFKMLSTTFYGGDIDEEADLEGARLWVDGMADWWSGVQLVAVDLSTIDRTHPLTRNLKLLKDAFVDYRMVDYPPVAPTTPRPPVVPTTPRPPVAPTTPRPPVAPTTPRPPDKVERKKLIGWGPVALILGILALILFKGD